MAPATMTGTETGKGTTGDIARAPGTEETAAARALLAATEATTGAMETETAAIDGGRTIGQSPSGSAGTRV